jgi:integrase
VTAGLPREYFGLLNRIPKEDATIVMDYMVSLKAEVNPSEYYRRDVIKCLSKFVVFCRNDDRRPTSKTKNLKELDRKDVLAFLDSLRKSEIADPLHKWIGTYNLYRTHLIRFFKWLYSPDIEPDRRVKPAVVENIQKLRIKEKSIYKPTDLWTFEDDLVFLKYCPSKRMKCFHMMAKDTSCRPHELLKLQIKT